MIVMPVPKDIRSIKAKFIGAFTKRQTFAVVPAGVIGAILFFTLGSQVSSETLVGIIGIVDTPILLCGFVDVYGMPIWVFVKDVAIGRFLAPKHRPYSTENIYAGYAKQNKITYEYFDGEEGGSSPKAMRRKNKENKKRLGQFLKENPELKPIE